LSAFQALTTFLVPAPNSLIRGETLPFPAIPRRSSRNTPKQGRIEAATFPFNLIRTLLVFGAGAYLLKIILGHFGIMGVVERLGIALVLACLLTPLVLLLINRGERFFERVSRDGKSDRD
jgi:hypothetical protein